MGTSQLWLQRVLESHVGTQFDQHRFFFALLLRDTGSGPIVDNPDDATLADLFVHPTNREAITPGYERRVLHGLVPMIDAGSNQARLHCISPVLFDDLMPGETYVGVVIFEGGTPDDGLYTSDSQRLKVAMQPINPPVSNVAELTVRFGPGPYYEGSILAIDAVEANEVITPAPNLLVNGGHLIAQTGTAWTSASTFPNDDATYLTDQWILLSDGNDVVDVSRVTTVLPEGVGRSMLFDVETADLKFGMLQIIEHTRVRPLQGRHVSLQVRLTRGGGGTSLGQFKLALLSWSGSANEPTRDPIDTWNDSGVTPTLVADWSVVAEAEIGGTLLDVPGTWNIIKLEGVEVPEDATNLGFFVWCDDKIATVGDFLYLAGARLNLGQSADAWVERGIAEEVPECQYYYQKTFSADTTPAQNAGVAGALSCVGGATAGKLIFEWKFPVPLRSAAPVLTTYNPSAANAEARNATDDTDTAVTNLYSDGSAVAWVATADDATDAGDLMHLHATADARF
jgi:hypothetical protein